MRYGLYFIYEKRVELHSDLSTLSASVKHSAKAIGGWLRDGGGSYMGNGWFVTEKVNVIKSRRGNGK